MFIVTIRRSDPETTASVPVPVPSESRPEARQSKRSEGSSEARDERNDQLCAAPEKFSIEGQTGPELKAIAGIGEARAGKYAAEPPSGISTTPPYERR